MVGFFPMKDNPKTLKYWKRSRREIKTIAPYPSELVMIVYADPRFRQKVKKKLSFVKKSLQSQDELT